MSEVIDFSEREEEFLSRDLIQKVLSYAVISAILGFAISALIFLEGRAGPASELLDRRAAEGQVVTHEGSDHSYNSSRNGGAFRAPSMSPRTKRSERERAEAWKNVKHLKAQQVSKPTTLASNTPKKTPKRIIKANLESASSYKQADKSASVKAKASTPDKKAAPPPTAADLNRLLYPASTTRPARASFSEVEESLRQNLVFIPSEDQGGYLGLVIDESGKILVSSQALKEGVLSRVWIDGSPKSARLVSEDPDHGCALIQVSSGNYKTIPLAPSPPAPGQKLLTFRVSGRGGESLLCQSGIRFGQAGFIVDGEMPATQVGAPVLNDRGEFVGFHVSSLPDLPGRGYSLASDSSVIYRLARGYRGPSGGLSSFENEALVGLSSYLADQRDSNQSPNGRIVPGQGISFFHLGMSRSEALGKVSQPEESTLKAGLDLVKSPAPPLDLYFAHDRLILIATQHKGFSTIKGLATGSELNERQLQRQFENGHISGSQALVPGLDIILNRSQRVVKFIARADMGRR